jgi:hypothetical protein
MKKNKDSESKLKKYLIAKCIQNPEFKKTFLANPKLTIEKELKIQMPNEVNIKVLEVDENDLCILIPSQNLLEKEMSDEELQEVAGGRWWIFPTTKEEAAADWEQFRKEFAHPQNPRLP